MENKFSFTAVIHEANGGGAFIPIPFDIKKKFGKGRLKINATFDNIPYSGSIVNMGFKNDDGSVCYVLGILKAIRKKLGKNIGDSVNVQIEIIV